MRYAAYLRENARRWGKVAPLLALGMCAPVMSAGCLTYGSQRQSMPPLGTDVVSEWVAVTDTALTEACR